MKIEEELQTTNFKDEVQKAGLNILFTAAWLHNKTSCTLKDHGLYHEQYNVLRILRGQGTKRISQKEILCRMINKNSNLTRIIDKLKAKKLVSVQVSETDKREYMIGITKTGINLLNRIDKDLNAQAVSRLNLSESEAFHLNALLDKLRDID